MAIAYIGVGSNLNNPEQQTTQAVEKISRLSGTRVTTISRWYRTRAIGPGEQPDHINGVVKINTELSPKALLAALQDIENLHGRVRGQRWGPRTLDLDILLYDNLVQDDTSLTIPHPRLGERGFVLVPLSDVDPGLRLPNGASIKSLLENCSTEGIVALSEGE